MRTHGEKITEIPPWLHLQVRSRTLIGGEIVVDRLSRLREDYGFESACDQKQCDVRSGRFADRIDEPNRVSAQRLRGPGPR